jgi:hypothetical protein
MLHIKYIKTTKGGNIMAEAKEKPVREVKERVREYRDEYADISTEFTRLIRESYLTGFQIGLSLWERNLKAIGRQIDQWVSAQESYARLMEAVNFWGGNSKPISNQIEKIFALQRDYVNQMRSLSERGIQQMDEELRERS